MKILMVTTDHNDKVLAVLAFKNLNAANSIDFVSTTDELMDYIAVRSSSKMEMPNLVLVDIQSNGRNVSRELRANSTLAGLNVITYSTQVFNKKSLHLEDVKEQDSNASRVEELDWILKEICSGLQTKDGWQYSIKPSLSSVMN